jgi:hypothetical protein
LEAGVVNLAEIAALRRDLWRMGYRAVPLTSFDDPDRDTAGKKPLHKDWADRARRNPPEAAVTPAETRLPNTRVLADELRAIDADVDDFGRADAVEQLAIQHLGGAPTRRRDNSNRFLMLYRAAEGVPGKRTLKGTTDKIEVLGKGQQFVAYGKHASGGTIYWTGPEPLDMSVDQLPAVTEDQISKFLAACATVIGTPTPPPRKQSGNGASEPLPNLERITAALRSIPSDDYDTWIRCGCAIYHATQGSDLGLELWDRWSAGSSKYDADEIPDRWASFGNHSGETVGVATIFHLAQHYGGTLPEPDSAREDAQPPFLDEPADDIEFVGPPIIPISRIPPRQWAYGRFLLFGSAAVIGALDGTGKGYIAVAIMLALITGRDDILGEKVWRKGNVAIVTYEDGIEEWQRRFAAACIQHSEDYERVMQSVRFVVKRGGRVVFAQAGREGVLFPDSASIAQGLKAGGFVLMLIDPFNNAHALEDGNNNVAIAAVAAEMSRIASVAGVVVLVLHHLRKGARGDPDDLMGALMLRANFRACRIFQKMTAEEAGKLGIATKDAWRYIRLSGTKENYNIPADKAVWVKLESVPLGNAAGLYPEDWMGAAIVWEPPAMFEGMNVLELHAVFAAIVAKPHARAKQAAIIPWIGRPLLEVGNRTDDQANKIVAAWVKSGVLVPGEPHHATNRTTIQTLVTEPVKVAEILNSYPLRDARD